MKFHILLQTFFAELLFILTKTGCMKRLLIIPLLFLFFSCETMQMVSVSSHNVEIVSDYSILIRFQEHAGTFSEVMKSIHTISGNVEVHSDLEGNWVSIIRTVRMVYRG